MRRPYGCCGCKVPPEPAGGRRVRRSFAEISTVRLPLECFLDSGQSGPVRIKPAEPTPFGAAPGSSIHRSPHLPPTIGELCKAKYASQLSIKEHSNPRRSKRHGGTAFGLPGGVSSRVGPEAVTARTGSRDEIGHRKAPFSETAQREACRRGAFWNAIHPKGAGTGAESEQALPGFSRAVASLSEVHHGSPAEQRESPLQVPELGLIPWTQHAPHGLLVDFQFLSESNLRNALFAREHVKRCLQSEERGDSHEMFPGF